jgi:hypothetical protein
MNLIVLSEPDKTGFQKAFDYCKQWGVTHQAEIGVVEIAMGAGLIAWGLQSGLIHMGSDVVGSKWADIGGMSGLAVGTTGGPLIAATLLKSIFVGGVSGVAGVTSIAALPVIALIGGGAAIFGAFGYLSGSIAGRISDAFSPSFGDYVVGASVVAIGVALMIDGARRIVKDERVLELASKFKDGVIRLGPHQGTEVVAKTWDDLQRIVKEIAKSPYLTTGGSAATGAAAGAAIGGSMAASSVTILGSHSLGAVALSLGLVSAPVWPVIAGGAAGLAIGVAAWKGIKHFQNKRNNNDSADSILLASPNNE